MKYTWLIFTLFLISCGGASLINPPSNNCTVIKSGKKATITCPDGTSVTLEDGNNGMDGQDSVVHSSMPIPTTEECYSVAPNVWVENEGNHIDVYNNADCDHGPLPKTEYCNNVYEQEMCPVGILLFYPEDTYKDMVIHMLKFN